MKRRSTQDKARRNASLRDTCCRRLLLGGRSLGLEALEPRQLLSIDPTMGWAQFFGGTGPDIGYAVTVDVAGNAYVTGLAGSSDFAAGIPTVQGREYKGAGDVFVVKVGAEGAPQWKAFVGGSGYEYSRAIAVDASGAIFIAGKTESNNPESDFRQRMGGDYDAFVAKLKPDGELEWGSCLGGNGGDDAFGIAVDALGNAWVTGWTMSSNFPASPTNLQGFDPSYNGGDRDAFLAKFTSSGQLDWGAYLGGSGLDHGDAVTVDMQGNAYVTGRASSSDFAADVPTVSGREYRGGNGDFFVVKVGADGAPQWKAFVGGSGYEYSRAVAVDASSGAIFIAGNTESNDPQSDFGPRRGGDYDAVVVKLTPNGELEWGSCLGGNGGDDAFGIAVDALGNAWVTGWTSSSNFPASPTNSQGFDTSYNGDRDGFLAKFTSSGQLDWGSYIGGTGYDHAWGIAAQPSGTVFVTGETTSTAFDSLSSASPYIQHADGPDVFVAKIGNPPPSVAVQKGSVTVDEGQTASNTGTWSDTADDTVTLAASVGTVTKNNDGTWAWSFATTDGPAESQTVTITVTDTNTGTASATFQLVVNNVAPTVDAGEGTTMGEGGTLGGSGSFSDPGADTCTATVDYGDGTSVQDLTLNPDGTFDLSHAYASAGNYTVTITVRDSQGAESTCTLPVSVTNVAPTAAINGAPASSPEGTRIDLTSTTTDPGSADTFTYAWSVTKIGSAYASGSASTFSFTPDDNGSYAVSLTVTDDDGGTGSDSETITVTNVAPVAEDDSAETNEDVAVAIAVLANDSDVAGPADPLQIVGVTDGTHGTTRIDDNGTPGDTTDDRIVYTPNPNFSGADSFDYTITDGDGGFAAATVSVTVRNLVDLSGRVFEDRDNDGVFDVGDGDQGIAGVTLRLFNQEDDPEAATPIATATSGADGAYSFDANLGAGTYKIVQTQPAGLLDGKETAGALGGSVDNTKDWNEISDIRVIAGDPDASGYLFAEIRPSDLQGMVWEDFNNDGEVNFGEKAIEGVTVTLTGTDDRGNTVGPIEAGIDGSGTDADGIYMFIDLRPGTYTITETQPAGFEDGKDTLGTVRLRDASAGSTVGDNSVSDVFSGVVLPLPDSVGENYNFGERPPANGEVTPGQTATIGFWQNKNGQALIRSLNDDTDPMRLGDWLSATFPSMYGTLAGQTNDGVAAFYTGLFLRTKKEAVKLGLTGPVKMDAQVMAVAFACYVTNETLAGSIATSYGFLVTEHGVGTATFNVGIAGQAFGVQNGSVLAILDLLFATDYRSWNGVLYDLDHDGSTDDTLGEVSETLLRMLANDVYSAINEQGHI